MRTKVAVFLIINVLVVAFLVHSVWTLLSLLVVDGSNDAILRAELPAPNSDMIEKMPQIIPKIIHQTYKNTTIPEAWRAAQESCLSLHKDYQYMLWTDDSAREFIKLEYPWFLDTWDGYPHNIQRADSIRYFVLAHYGGIYIDLDDGCQRRLDPLLAYASWVRRTTPTGISNDVMGSTPGHPFFLEVIDSLPKYNRNWLSPYITTMASTGPLFLSLIWRHYNAINHPESERVRILFPDSYMSHSWSFFSHHLGNSWHNKDARLLFWMSQHWAELTVLGFLVGFAVIGALWFAYNRMFGSPSPRNYGLYQRLPTWTVPSWPKWKLRRENIELADRYEV